MKFLDKSFNALLISGACSILVACGGGSDAPSSPEVLTGVFIDSPVSGITYKTATQSGVTDVDGKFKYISGEKVTFSIGAIVLPETLAKSRVTPLDIASTSDVNNQVVSNILVLLQSLDADGIPTNGIQIPETAKTNATYSVDFNVPSATFSTNSSVLGLIENSGSFNTAPVSKEAAIAHFESSMSETNGAASPPATTASTPATTAPTYTLYKPDLSVTSGVSVTSDTNGAAVTKSIPLTSTLTATFTTSDNGATYTWGGAAVGGNIKANGNVALACTANTATSGYVAVSSQATPVSLASIRNITFDEFMCGNNTTSSGALKINGDGSATLTIGGVIDGQYTADQTSKMFSTTGLTTLEGSFSSNISGTIYSFIVGSVTRYFYVIRANEPEGMRVHIGVQQ